MRHCDQTLGDCLVQTHIEDSAAEIRVGVFATDASYWQVRHSLPFV